MAVVIAALLPVFLLIVLGFILKRSLMRLETQWHGLERLTYYVLFPVLLMQTLVKADLSKVPVAGVGGALFLSVLLMSLLCLALQPLLARFAVDGPAFSSIFQGAIRWQTYVALAVSGNLFGDVGLALASVAMVAMIPLGNVFSVAVLAHYASPEKRSVGSIAMTVVRNPLIWACVIGLLINVTHIPLPKLWHEVADALGRSSLAIGLLVTGAGLHLEGMFRSSLVFRSSLAASVAVFLKLVLMPVIAVALALLFGLTGSNLAIVTACSAVPTASSAYVLARQMGGDAPLLAQIITLQTILAAITMPVAIALVTAGP
jgi:malonate transporter